MYFSFFIASIIGWCLDWTTFQYRDPNKMIDRLRNFKLHPVWIRHCRWKSFRYDLDPMIDMWNGHPYYWMKTISTDIWKTFCNSFYLMWFIWWSCVRTRHLRDEPTNIREKTGKSGRRRLDIRTRPRIRTYIRHQTWSMTKKIRILNIHDDTWQALITTSHGAYDVK